MSVEPDLDRVAGVLLGAAAGDALGAGYEFGYPSADEAIGMIGGGPFGWAPGEWTDDTSMALAIAMAARDGTDIGSGAGLDAVAAGFVEWFDTRPPDIGNQTCAVLSHRSPSAGEMHTRAAALGGLTAGNGSLMRTAPVALAYLDDAAGCVAAAAAIGALTHADERATQACAMWTYAIRHAVLHGNFDGLRMYLDSAPRSVAEFWVPLLDAAENGGPADFAKNGWVVHALQTAWWAITHADRSGPRHLQHALELAVRAGGDTDTTAAIAGGLLGARWGASAVPAAWRRILHGYPGFRSEDLVRVAVRIALRGRSDRNGWPAADVVDYARFDTGNIGVHPHDPGVSVSGVGHYRDDGFDAVVSLCRVGTAPVAGEHVRFWLLDAGHDRNPNLEFVLDDAARTVKQLRAEGKTVLLHCVEGKSRTPSVAARYSILLGRDPNDVLTAMPWARPDRALWQAAVAPGQETARSSSQVR